MALIEALFYSTIPLWFLFMYMSIDPRCSKPKRKLGEYLFYGLHIYWLGLMLWAIAIQF